MPTNCPTASPCPFIASQPQWVNNTTNKSGEIPTQRATGVATNKRVVFQPSQKLLHSSWTDLVFAAPDQTSPRTRKLHNGNGLLTTAIYAPFFHAQFNVWMDWAQNQETEPADNIQRFDKIVVAFKSYKFSWYKRLQINCARVSACTRTNSILVLVLVHIANNNQNQSVCVCVCFVIKNKFDVW